MKANAVRDVERSAAPTELLAALLGGLWR